MTQQPTKVEGQGLAGPSNPIRSSEESTEQRLDRWRKLRNHLRDFGLSEGLPDDLLLEPEPTTRPNVRLVAHYDEIKQKSLGNSTVAEVVAVVLAAVAVVFSFTAMGAQGSLVLSLVLLALLMRPIRRLIDSTVASKGSLSLTPEELSMSLPGRNRHARWTDVYAVSVNQRGKRFSRQWPWVRRKKAPCVRVELDDGIVARLYLCAAECEPLADLMRDFVVHHRGDHTAAPETAS